LVAISILIMYIESLSSGITIALFGLFLLVYPHILNITNRNNNKRMINVEEEYEFDDDSVKVTTFLLDEEIASSDVKYGTLQKVVENRDYIFIYINKSNVHIIDKSQISQKDCQGVIENISKVMEQKR